MKIYFYLIYIALFIFFGCKTNLPPAENVNLPAIFSNNMVLQADKPITVWGKATPSTRLEIMIGDSKKIAEVDENGRWKIDLPEMQYGGPFNLYVIGKDTLVYVNVMIGEVWVCSGQSNMEWSVNNSNNAQEEIENANYPNIRLFTVTKNVSDEPLADCEGTWEVCKPSVVSGFSAVGYFFGRDLHTKMNVPIGLIHSSWGGTPIEAWMKYSTLQNDSMFSPIITSENPIFPSAKLGTCTFLLDTTFPSETSPR